MKYNYEDDYSYNHIIREYEDVWPGQKEPPVRKIKTKTWNIVIAILLLINFIELFLDL